MGLALVGPSTCTQSRKGVPIGSHSCRLGSSLMFAPDLTSPLAIVLFIGKV